MGRPRLHQQTPRPPTTIPIRMASLGEHTRCFWVMTLSSCLLSSYAIPPRCCRSSAMRVRTTSTMLQVLIVLAAATDVRGALECASLTRAGCDNSTWTPAAFDSFCKGHTQLNSTLPLFLEVCPAPRFGCHQPHTDGDRRLEFLVRVATKTYPGPPAATTRARSACFIFKNGRAPTDPPSPTIDSGRTPRP